jgi:hypothetical protein
MTVFVSPGLSDLPAMIAVYVATMSALMHILYNGICAVCKVVSIFVCFWGFSGSYIMI